MRAGVGAAVGVGLGVGDRIGVGGSVGRTVGVGVGVGVEKTVGVGAGVMVGKKQISSWGVGKRNTCQKLAPLGSRPVD